MIRGWLCEWMTGPGVPRRAGTGRCGDSNGYILLIVIRATGFFQSRYIGMKSP